MARQLAKAVVVRGRKGDVLFLPGQNVPEWAQKLITNPHAWGPDDEQDEQPLSEADDVDSDVDDVDEDGIETDDDDPGDPESTEEMAVPPKSGTGSGKDAWLAYAASHDVEVDDSASRDVIIAALDEAGVPTSA